MHVWNSESLRVLRQRLVPWFRRHGRELPWRQTHDPYRIWVSEIMLQQTQVATVIPYYERFLSTFPDVASLAAAPEEKVLRHWEGLGYYRRARLMHAAAKTIVAEHGGDFPRAAEAVRALPGIGRYTAGAILSFAYDDREPIVEANTLRLYSRLLAYEGDVTTRAAHDALWKFASDVLPARGSGQLNQALMELGSQVCTPRSPACGDCPVAHLCPTRALGAQDRIPLTTKKMKYEDVDELAAVVRRGEWVLVRLCGPDERWAGLWDFPRFAAKNASDPAGDLREGVKKLTAVEIEPGEELTVIKHGVTRFRITLRCHGAVAKRTPRKLADGVRWVSIDELAALPLSVTGRKIAELVRVRGG